MLETLRSLVGGDQRAEVVRECRDCGTVVGNAERCPSCESNDIARFEIE
jgi:predicted Zn-ribbon and HTH transcriptional regulator